MAVQKGESLEPPDRGKAALVPSLRVSRLVAILLVLLAAVAGYHFAALWSGARDTTPLTQICARVDYMNGLQQETLFVAVGKTEVRSRMVM
jgi:hypothetical protein